MSTKLTALLLVEGVTCILLVTTLFSQAQAGVYEEDDESYEGYDTNIPRELNAVSKALTSKSLIYELISLSQVNTRLAANAYQMDLKLKYCRKNASALTNAKEICKNQVDGIDIFPVLNGIYSIIYDKDNLKTWYEANDFCQLHGMNLLRLDHIKENSALSEKMKKINVAGEEIKLWISPNDLNSYGKFVSSGWGTEATHLPWAASTDPEPENSKHCVAISNLESGLVTFRHECSSKFGFVCEMSQPCATLIIP